MTYDRLLKNAFGIAFGFCILAVPGYSSTAFLDFGGGSGGEIQVSGSGAGSSIVTSTFSVPYTSLFISGAADAADDGTWTLTSTSLTLSGGTFTLNGTIGTCTGCSAGANLGGVSGALETIVVSGFPYTSSNPPTSSGYYVSSDNKQIIAEYGTPTSITELSTLLTDLGEGSHPTTTMTSGGFNGSGTGSVSGGKYTFTPTSSTMDLSLTPASVATPEPVSFLLLGGGLIGVAWAGRKRRSDRS